jgi:SAM-dependent methyltransferase
MDKKKSFVKQFWGKRAQEVEHPRIATHFRIDDASDFDFSLVQKLCTPSATVLDLGAGTCHLSIRLSPYAKEIIAVDFIEDFLAKQNLPSNIRTVVSDIGEFETTDTFDIILLFGVLNYFFEDNEVLSLYEKCRSLLNHNGVLIVKHQCGIRKNELIDHYSEELESNYLALYRHVDLDFLLLGKIFNDVQMIDVYPPRLNRWENTHFYCFVCRA